MKYEKKLSRDIMAAVQAVKNRFDNLCTKDNFYLNHFNGDKSELIRDKEGFFSELVMQDMFDEVVELVRNILLKKDYFESNPHEYLFPLIGYNKRSKEDIEANKQRNEELKRFYNFIGDECDTAAGLNFNKKG